jgi:flagella basal body P-ring formation protein FlgA
LRADPENKLYARSKLRRLDAETLRDSMLAVTGTTLLGLAKLNLSGPGITATIRDAFYKVSSKDVGDAIAEQLALQAVESKAEVIMNPGTPNTMYSDNKPVKIAIHALQIDDRSKRWQAQAYFLVNGQTASVQPIAGTYGALVDVPVLTRQFNHSDVIEASDIRMQSIPERLLHKDTITDSKQIIGQAPRVGISANRPIRLSEVTAPMVVKRGDLVEMRFATPYIEIKATGIALEDGAPGEWIRIKNQKSQHAVSGRVVSAGRVMVGNAS